ncbi:STAS domain-containing protein [Chitinophagaceae bacterium LWZ2-11]
MQVKIDTKEKFTVITPNESHIYDNMTEQLVADCRNILERNVKNAILDLKNVAEIDERPAENIAMLQQKFYEHNASFVICEMKDTVEAVFEKLEVLDILNITPTESEAWDIVQMEEIERELLDTDDIEFNTNE